MIEDALASAQAAALWAGLLVLLMFTLSILVVRQRTRHKVLIGDEGVPELVRAGRAFGNAAEYAPAGMAALAMLALVGAAPWLIHVIGGVLFAGRAAHAVAISLNAGVSVGRAGGMIATWLALLAAGVTLVFYAVG